MKVNGDATLILLAFITGNTNLQPLREGLFAQITIDLKATSINLS